MSNSTEHLYIITYDIANTRRWRAVFKLMKGYGEWLQLSVFQCRLSEMQHAELIYDLDLLINHSEDHVLLMNLGTMQSVSTKVTSLGKTYQVPNHDVTIV